MGEAKAREDAAVKAAVDMATQQAQGHEVKLSPQQAAVVFSLQRCTASLGLEAKQLAESYGQREIAGELAGSVEHLNKVAMRFIADSQRTVIVPKLVMP